MSGVLKFQKIARFVNKYQFHSQSIKNCFSSRHIGPRNKDVEQMLAALGYKSLDEFTNKVVPKSIALNRDLKLDSALDEQELLARAEKLSQTNKLFKSYLGMGYNDTITPPVILRNVIENPGWITAYTPYQPEIAQGRLYGLLAFQTLVTDLCGLQVANASLLDEGTAAAEAMSMAVRVKKKNKFFVDSTCHPTTISVIETRAKCLGISIVVDKIENIDVTKGDFAGVLVQYPNTYGNIVDYSDIVDKCRAANTLTACATDLLALCLLKSPGEIGFDVALGNSQRFGVPLGHGGPHAAFFAVRQSSAKDLSLVRQMPGRIVGVTKDKDCNEAYRLALTTREQHIRREKATSNICTSQALLANVSAFYAIYHGPTGLRQIADRVYQLTRQLNLSFQNAGLTTHSKVFFDTLVVTVPDADAIIQAGLNHEINFRKISSTEVGISLDETTSETDLSVICKCFNISLKDLENSNSELGIFQRTSTYLQHDIFNNHHSEQQMVRLLKKLENKDISLVHSMIPLGSCTMKLNATSELIPIGYPGFSKLHPFVPKDQAEGYHELFKELVNDLSEITGYDTVSLQPNSGSQGEYTGLRTILAYHSDRNDSQRNVCLIPVSAHGTNPASANLAGMSVIYIDSDDQGNVDLSQLKTKAEEHKSNLGAIMITYPSTYGVFEEHVREVCDVIHYYGGQVYIDGANTNAQMGLCRLGDYGGDVSHLNLHKTFSIPHGGGGPGMGPIGVKKHLTPYLPSHVITPPMEDSSKSFGAVSSAAWGSSSILPIAWAYIKMMGAEGLKRSSQVAILSANYMKHCLAEDYEFAYTDANGYCAHEFIIDLRKFKETANIESKDIAKRLVDFGFHAPTQSFPISNSLMIEPTESEDLEEINRYITALKIIRQEIRDIEIKKISAQDSPLTNAPHSLACVTNNNWNRSYSRQVAAFPATFIRPESKYFSPVSRIDDTYGDRNFIGTLK